MKCTICENTLKGNQRKYCSNKCKQKAHWERGKSKNNSYHSQTIRGIDRKIYFVKLLGGKCTKCGYNKNLSALEFHHRDPEEKEFGLDVRRFANNSIEKVTPEVGKCDLLCANCHRELHNPEMNNLL